MKKKEYIGFDLDGTLINSYKAINDCLSNILPKYSNTIPEKVIDKIFPLTLDQFPKYIDFFSDKDFEFFKKDFMKSFDEIYFKKIEIIPGAKEVLKYSVKKYGINNVFILTNRRFNSAKQICTHFNFFEILENEKLFSTLKNDEANPKINSLRNIILQYYKKNLAGYYVGDSFLDIEAANKNLIIPIYINSKIDKSIISDFNLKVGYNCFDNLIDFSKTLFTIEA